MKTTDRKGIIHNQLNSLFIVFMLKTFSIFTVPRVLNFGTYCIANFTEKNDHCDLQQCHQYCFHILFTLCIACAHPDQGQLYKGITFHYSSTKVSKNPPMDLKNPLTAAAAELLSCAAISLLLVISFLLLSFLRQHLPFP